MNKTLRYEINTCRDSWGGWSLYNIWDNEEMEEIPIREGIGSNARDYTRDRAYAEKVCKEMNAGMMNT